MKRNILNSLLLSAIVVLALGCRAKKIIVATPPATDKIEVKEDKKVENLALLKSKDLSFKTLALKGKANLNINGDENNVTMNIRIEKDKKIWVIVTAGGGIIEAARAMITPDSLFLINKLQKTYTKKPFSYVYNFTNKQVSFGMLQAVLSGNTINDFMTDKSNLTQENGVWVLSNNVDDLAYKIIFNTLLKPSQVDLNDAKNAQAFKVTYGNYTPINNALFPSTLKINSMAGVKKISVDIQFVKIESNVPVDFPFTVPKNFERVN